MFFDQYKALCERIGKTPNGVAKELGFASSSITQWKHGSVPRPDKLRKICEYFNVTSEYLLGFTVDAQIDVTEYRLQFLRKELEKSTGDARDEIEANIAILEESLSDLKFSQLIASQGNFTVLSPKGEKKEPAAQEGSKLNVLDLSDLTPENRAKVRDYFDLVARSQDK
mgnify:CR=1 FL=1